MCARSFKQSGKIPFSMLHVSNQQIKSKDLIDVEDLTQKRVWNEGTK